MRFFGGIAMCGIWHWGPRWLSTIFRSDWVSTDPCRLVENWNPPRACQPWRPTENRVHPEATEWTKMKWSKKGVNLQRPSSILDPPQKNGRLNCVLCFQEESFMIYPLVNEHSYGKLPFLLGKPTISMAMFNSFVSLPESGTCLIMSRPTFLWFHLR